MRGAREIRAALKVAQKHAGTSAMADNVIEELRAQLDTARAAPRSAITRINDGLKKIGREERLIKGRGYYYLAGGEAHTFHHSAIYTNIIRPEHYQITLYSVNQLFADAFKFTDAPAPVVPEVQ